MSSHASRRWGPSALLLLLGTLATGCVFDRRSIALLGGDGGARADGASVLADAPTLPLDLPVGRERTATDSPRRSSERPEHPKLDLPRPEYVRPCEASHGDEPGFQLCASSATTCTFFMDPPGNSKRSCADACGAGCLEARQVDPASANCAPLGAQACGAPAKSLICTCRR